MPVNDELGKRMKEFYESIPKTRLVRRTPVAIRIDGKAFHTFTRGFEKPFDRALMKAMQLTMEYLCKHIQGCVFGYTQSDEITLILIDYQKLNSDAWFGYEVQKICSISASMATMAFNRYFRDLIEDYCMTDPRTSFETRKVYIDAYERGAMFDARCFNIPKEEVCNLIYWRQLDAIRNSIQMVGQAFFSSRELHGKSCDEIIDMLHKEKNVNWHNFPTVCQRGASCLKVAQRADIAGTINTISIWNIDFNMPILKGDDRKYVDDLIYVKED